MLMLHKNTPSGWKPASVPEPFQGNESKLYYDQNILERGLDKQTQLPLSGSSIPDHNNIRGKDHYQ